MRSRATRKTSAASRPACWASCSAYRRWNFSHEDDENILPPHCGTASCRDRRHHGAGTGGFGLQHPAAQPAERSMRGGRRRCAERQHHLGAQDPQRAALFQLRRRTDRRADCGLHRQRHHRGLRHGGHQCLGHRQFQQEQRRTHPAGDAVGPVRRRRLLSDLRRRLPQHPAGRSGKLPRADHGGRFRRQEVRRRRPHLRHQCGKHHRRGVRGHSERRDHLFRRL